MFQFLEMANNYEDRKIGRENYEWGFISTAEVNDGNQPYETAVCHERYRDNGEMIIVEAYDTKSEAEIGHNKWTKIMTDENLPAQLEDIANAEIASFIGKEIYPLRENDK